MYDPTPSDGIESELTNTVLDVSIWEVQVELGVSLRKHDMFLLDFPSGFDLSGIECYSIPFLHSDGSWEDNLVGGSQGLTFYDRDNNPVGTSYKLDCEAVG